MRAIGQGAAGDGAAVGAWLPAPAIIHPLPFCSVVCLPSHLRLPVICVWSGRGRGHPSRPPSHSHLHLPVICVCSGQGCRSCCCRRFSTVCRCNRPILCVGLGHPMPPGRDPRIPGLPAAGGGGNARLTAAGTGGGGGCRDEVLQAGGNDFIKNSPYSTNT